MTEDEDLTFGGLEPSVGDDVHYVSYGSPVRPDGTQAFKSLCRAAKVTEVGETEVGLVVLNPTGFFFHPICDGGSVWDEDGRVGGSWHWPGPEC